MTAKPLVQGSIVVPYTTPKDLGSHIATVAIRSSAIPVAATATDVAYTQPEGTLQGSLTFGDYASLSLTAPGPDQLYAQDFGLPYYSHYIGLIDVVRNNFQGLPSSRTYGLATTPAIGGSHAQSYPAAFFGTVNADGTGKATGPTLVPYPFRGIRHIGQATDYGPDVVVDPQFHYNGAVSYTTLTEFPPVPYAGATKVGFRATFTFDSPPMPNLRPAVELVETVTNVLGTFEGHSFRLSGKQTLDGNTLTVEYDPTDNHPDDPNQAAFGARVESADGFTALLRVTTYLDILTATFERTFFTPAPACQPQLLSSYPHRCFPWKTSTGLNLLSVSDTGEFAVLTPDLVNPRSAFVTTPVGVVPLDTTESVATEYGYGFCPLTDTRGVFLSQKRGADSKTLARVVTLTDGVLTVTAAQTIDTHTTAPTRVRRAADDLIFLEQQINDPSLSINRPVGFALAAYKEVTYSVSDAGLAQVNETIPQQNFFRIASSSLASITSAHWGAWFAAGGPHASDIAYRGYAMAAITHESSSSDGPYTTALLDLGSGASICQTSPYNANQGPLAQWCDFGYDGTTFFGGSAVLPDGRGLALVTFGTYNRVTYLYELQPQYTVNDFNGYPSYAVRDDGRGLDTGQFVVRRWKVPTDQSAPAPQIGHVVDAQWYLADPGLLDQPFDPKLIRMVRRQIDNTRGGSQNVYGASRYDLFQFTLDRDAPRDTGLKQTGPGLYLNHDSPGPPAAAEPFTSFADGGPAFIGPGQQPLVADLGGGVTLVSLHHSASDGRLNWHFDSDRTVLVGCAPKDVSLGIDPGPFISLDSLAATLRQGSLAFE